MTHVPGARAVGLALLLAGVTVGPAWYLLIPPVGTDDVANGPAPLGRWAALSTYDTREECEAARVRAGEWAQQLLQRDRSLGAYGYAQCIAANDTRLLSE